MTRFLWPVTDNAYSMRPIAFFFEERDAAAFINSELGKRNLYECEPRYDRREAGYRPAEKLNDYRDWLASLEPVRRPDGRWQVAA
jgi:hypothetical protein